MFIVRLEDGVYTAPWDGNPGICLSISSSKIYNTIIDAANDIVRARRYKEFKNARIINISKEAP